jgi:hypothetical protein
MAGEDHAIGIGADHGDDASSEEARLKDGAETPMAAEQEIARVGEERTRASDPREGGGTRKFAHVAERRACRGRVGWRGGGGDLGMHVLMVAQRRPTQVENNAPATGFAT